ncbi:MAG: spore germination protein [Alicyclobacillaceae bacterium]|nr:spore germination protein [Alicyclobacillaceae bacterium]
MTKQATVPDIAKNLDTNVNYLNQLLGVGQGPGHSWDIMAKAFGYGDLRMMSYVLNGYFLTMDMVLILREFEKHVLMFQESHAKDANNMDEMVDYLNKNVGFVQVQTVNKMQDAIRFILSGPLITFIDGFDNAFMIDTRIYPMRSIEPTEVERVIRGPRDGFVETMLMNTALIRRRLRDPALRAELMQIGTRSKTDVTLMYLGDVANPELVNRVRKSLQAIDSDIVSMAEQAVTDIIAKVGWNPYPTVRYTERPDVAATALVDGHIVIVVDTSPEVIIAPITLFQLLQHPEEYHSYPTVGTYMRWVSIIACLVSVLLPGIFLLANLHPNVVPPQFGFLKIKNNGPMPLWAELFIAEIALDILRMAVLNTPVNIAAMVSIIAAFAFGELAPNVNFLPPQVLLYVALVLVAQLALPSYELATANQISRFWIIFWTQVGHWVHLHAWGFVFSVVTWIVFLATRKSFGVPYLWPLMPFKWTNGMHEILLRRPMTRVQGRPEALGPKMQNRK